MSSKFVEIETIKLDLLAEKTAENNIWLSEPDAIALKQRLIQQAESNSADFQNLHWLMATFREILTLSDAPTVERASTACWKEYEDRNRMKGIKQGSEIFGQSDIDVAFASATADRLTASDINLTKREAQSKLSAADFKLWKKAQKALKKQGIDDD